MEPLLLLGGLGAAWLATFIAVRIRDPHRRAWSELADKLQLDFDPAVDVIRGVLGAEEVEARVVGRSADGGSIYVRVTGRMPVPLDLGLKITSHAAFAGPLNFEARFDGFADEVTRLRSLVTPQVKRALMAAYDRESEIYVGDHAVTIKQPVFLANKSRVESALRHVSKIVRALRDASVKVRPAAALAPYDIAWRKLAAHMALQTVTTPLCMWGKIEQLHVHAYSVRTARDRYAIEVRMAFSRNLHMGLLVQSPAMLNRPAELWAKDVKLGDPLFDDAFIVRCDEIGLLREVFDKSFRAIVLGTQHELGPLWFMDDGVGARLPTLNPSPDALRNTVIKLAALANHIEQQVHGPSDQRVGPYR